MTMALPNCILLILLVLLLPSFDQVLSTTYSHSDDDEQNETIKDMINQVCADTVNSESCYSNFQSECANLSSKSPISILNAALKATMTEAQRVITLVTKFSALSINPREQIAIEDCVELLDYSVEELGWSMQEMEKIRNSSIVTHHEGNLKAWLSAALSNQDTCLEGFEGTSGHIERYIRGSLKQVTQLISNVLAMYNTMHSVPAKPHRNRTTTSTWNKLEPEFPTWVLDRDREFVAARLENMNVDAIVALDGSGQFQSIMEAVNQAPNYSERRYVIYVKKGVYRENVELKKKKTNIMLVGDGMGITVISANRNFLQGWTTFRTATFAVSGKGFIARDLTFRNTAGPQNRQAVALRVDSDQSAFFHCSIEGYQDTLYAHSLRQFYRECSIYGTIDFIFGNGAAVIQGCKIFTRQPLPYQKVTITAQGRKDPNQSTGFSIQSSYIYASQPTYLGRPWKQYSRTVYMQTYMSSQVQPRGWLEWFGDFALNTLYYGEYMNYGPGASLSGRVKWPGYHAIHDAVIANFFTVGRFIDGRAWLPSTGVKFQAVVDGDGFVGKGITFRNTAGPSKGQAVAVRTAGDLTTFYKCSFEAYQDTLYTHSQRQFFRECDVYGTVDFIFGNAAVVFQNCNIYARQPNQGQGNMVTAQSKSDINQNTGTSFQNCNILATPDLDSSSFTVKTFLGRPWRAYATVVYMQSFIDRLIDPAGWDPWTSEHLNTLYYAEFNNRGPGSNTSNRVTWPGFHVIDATDAARFTVSNLLIQGHNWLDATKVPYHGGLL
ncbi:Pectinesterase [Macleaya cordata]|uniref:Pectinesterase n=1 Tax=Macleaya cordata TaxID=56857 RepID=A0A200QSJ9_MACCD|nr:Pectinesterase [Macleaya cordata]